MRTDALRREHPSSAQELGAAARELERRLLVYAEEVHTESGAHAKQLESWTHWAERSQVLPAAGGAGAARAAIEAAVRAYARDEWRADLLPWNARASERR